MPTYTSATPPEWETVLLQKASMFPYIAKARDPKGACIEIVDYQGKMIPTVIVKQPQGAFRTNISNDTHALILMDVVTVLPFPTPFAYVIPIVFDESRNPFWTMIFLCLFPLRSAQGVPLKDETKEAAMATRKTVLNFCQKPPICGLVVLEDNDLKIGKIVPFSPIQTERLEEIKEIIHFLDKFDITRYDNDFKLPTQIFIELCAFLIQDLEGKGLVVPRGRSLRMAMQNIYSIKVDHGRLIDRQWVSTTSRVTGQKYDLFISHAHTDTEAAHLLSDWLVNIWPKFRISVTKPENGKKFQQNPGYFLDASRSAKAIIYLVTPNSLNRPMVDTEIGGNADKPIVSILLGVTIDQLKEKLKGNLFLAVDLKKAVELKDHKSAEKLIEILAAELDFLPPEVIEPVPNLKIQTETRDNLHQIQNYVEDEQFIRRGVKRRQTVEEADAIVGEALRRQLRLEGQADQELPQNPYHKFLALITTAKDEGDWPLMLESVPALLNDKLLSELDLIAFGLELTGETSMANKLQRLRNIIIKVKSFWE